MRPRLVITLGAISGISLVFGCSYDWNVASQGDGGASSSSSGVVASSSSSSGAASSSSSSSGTAPVVDSGTGPQNGRCGSQGNERCTCKEGAKCDFACVANRTCKLTCEEKSECNFTCVTGSTCEIECQEGAKCTWKVETGGEIIARCDDKPAACTGECALASGCTNKCKADQCKVACTGGLPVCTIRD